METFSEYSRAYVFRLIDKAEKNGELICLNGKVALKTRVYEDRRVHKGKYLYVIESCSYCRFKKYCQSGLKEIRKYRIFDVNYDYFKIRKQVTENLLSPKGIEMRVNRSSQVEGAFGVLKQDYGFRKFLTRGKVHVTVEMLLLCFGYNVQKLHNKIQNNRCGQQLHTQKVA